MRGSQVIKGKVLWLVVEKKQPISKVKVLE